MFITEGQLEVIQFAVSRTKNQGEMAVYNFIVKNEQANFNAECLNVLKYIAEECTRQHSGGRSVYSMALAWHYADMHPYSATTTAADILDFIIEVGVIIEPIKNVNGYRRVSVGIMDAGLWQEKAPWTSIERLLNLLVVSFADGDLEAANPHAKDAIDELYYQFEEIHPFLDGNGRTGKVLYNWIKGTMRDPVMPPLFWEGSIP